MIEPTVTQRVRAFLAAEGAPLAPWTTLDETYGGLYELLASKRGDPAFWPSLGKLVEELAADVPPSMAELLDGMEIERLVVDLERALPCVEQGRAKVAEFTASLAAPALCGFLLLGLAATSGCSDPQGTVRAVPSPLATTPAPLVVEAVKPAGADAGVGADAGADSGAKEAEPLVDAAWFDGCALEKKGVLWRHLERAALADGDKEALCDCFVQLDKRWTNRLSFLFRNAKPAEVAKALEEMVACCEADEKASDPACRDVAKIRNAVELRIWNSPLGAPMYKGVCFV